MSHTYYVFADNDIHCTELHAVGLSDEDHSDWMTKAGLVREMRNTETGEVQTWLYHTTVHDLEPLSVYSCEFAAYVDAAQEQYGNECPEHMRSLYDFVATVEALEKENGCTYRVFLF